MCWHLVNFSSLTQHCCGCAESFAREVRALAVTVYFGSAALLWAVDSPHLAAVMVHLNVLESVLALKIKALNDSVSKAVQQLQSVQLQFALLVRPLLPHASWIVGMHAQRLTRHMSSRAPCIDRATLWGLHAWKLTWHEVPQVTCICSVSRGPYTLYPRAVTCMVQRVVLARTQGSAGL